MKIRLRAKAGGQLQAFDGEGREIPGLLGFFVEQCGNDQVPVVYLRIRGPEVLIDDVEAKVIQAPPAAPSPGTPASVDGD